MNHYLYRLTTTALTGKKLYYIGYRSCDCAPEMDSYMSSSRLVKLMIQQGVIFTKEIITTFITRNQAYNAEQDVLKGLKCDTSSNYINIQIDKQAFDRATRRKKIQHFSKILKCNLGLTEPSKHEKKMVRKKLKKERREKQNANKTNKSYENGQTRNRSTSNDKCRTPTTIQRSYPA